MKNTIRVRRNGGKATVSSQSQNELALPKGDVHPTCLCLFDRERQEPFSKVPLTEPEFLAVVSASIKSGVNGGGVPAFVASAIREKISDSGEASMQALREFESAKDQSNTLLRLLATAMDSQVMGGQWGQEYANKMSGGIEELVSVTEDRLEAAFVNAWTNCHPNRKAIANERR